MTIPADIREKAEEIVGRMTDHVWKGDAIADIASAILEERERCAQIAYRYKPEPSCFFADGIEQSACLYGQGSAAGSIASAIRNEGEQKT